MKWSIIIFFLLLPSTFAFDCSIFSGLTKQNCIALNQTNESLIANLLYTSNLIADHSQVAIYNQHIVAAKPPTGTKITNGTYVRNSWIAILTIQPSIDNGSDLVVGSPFEIRTEYSYFVQVPGRYTNNKQKAGSTCRIDYSLQTNSSTLKVQSGSVSSNSKISYFVIYQKSVFIASLNMRVGIKSDTYTWQYSNRQWNCRYKSSSTSTESITISDNVTVTPRESLKPVTALLSQPYIATQRVLLNETGRSFVLSTDNASLTYQSQYYSARFIKPPYNFIQLVATATNATLLNNTIRNGILLAVPQTKTCIINSYDYFATDTYNCTPGNVSIQTQSTSPPQKNNWYLLAALAVIGIVIYGIYRILKGTWGRYFLMLVVLTALVPSAFASDCGLSNLGSCIPESIYNFILTLINSGFEPILDAINYFLTQPVSIDLFFPIWQVVIYILGFFYVIMLAFAGFKFLTSGHDILKREQAKEWLKNAFLAIVFTSASFYMYQLCIEVSATVTGGLMTMVPDTFFKITVDSISNIALEFFLSSIYLIVLLLTVILFCLRYILVAIGVIFVPFGVFCYFVPPLKGYGNLILQLVGVLNVVPIFCGLIALACSKLLGVSIFADFKIMLMISAFVFMDLLQAVALWHIVNASGLKGAIDKTISAGKYIAALVA